MKITERKNLTASQRTIELLNIAANGAHSKSAIDPVAIDVSERSPFNDAFLVVSGRSERNVSAIGDGIEEALHPHGVKPVRREGVGEGRWELLDFGNFVAHIFHEDEREYYNLERLWSDCPTISLDELEESAE